MATTKCPLCGCDAVTYSKHGRKAIYCRHCGYDSGDYACRGAYDDRRRTDDDDDDRRRRKEGR